MLHRLKSQHLCAALNESSSHMHISLNVWSPVRETIWKVLGNVALLGSVWLAGGGVSVGVSFEVSKAHA